MGQRSENGRQRAEEREMVRGKKLEKRKEELELKAQG
jgi:hypothetical protein